MSQTHIGLCDTPLEPSDDDRLGLDRYAKALARFAGQCETPITIALQGDWGSGKTSLMNLIRGHLSEKKEHCRCIWFNTWQYSQFGLENQLAASLISFFINALLPGENIAEKIDLKKILVRLGSAVGTGMGGVSGAAITAVSAALADAKSEKTDGDPAAYIADLKEKLTELVKKITEKDARIIVFIDDLDRLSPAKAVELLEAFKLFLDIRGCVFFLACDYKVINQGLKAKFGMEIASNNEKSFFDKIIQLPFKMPVLQYEVEKYIGDLLKKIDVKYDESDIKKYQQLIVTSIGFNPRGLKRAFNTLLLLKQVAEVEGEQESDPNTAAKVKQNEKDRLLFAIICMQLAYEFFYNFMYKYNAEDITPLFDKLRALDKYAKDEDVSPLLKEMKTEYEQSRFKGFIEALFKAMQLNFDNQDDVLSQGEAQVFRDMMQLSQVTSIEEAQDIWQEEQDYEVRGINNAVCRRLKDFLNKKCQLMKKRELEFYHQWHRGRSDMEVLLDTPNDNFSWMGVFLSRTGKPRTPYHFSIEVGLYDENKEKIFETLQMRLREAMPENKAIDQLEMVFEDNYWRTYVSLYREEHDCMNTEELYQKIERIANAYFDVLLQI